MPTLRPKGKHLRPRSARRKKVVTHENGTWGPPQVACHSDGDAGAPSLPHHHESLFRLGLVCCQMGRPVDGVELLGRAIQQSPQRAEYYHEICHPLMSLGHHREALTMNAAALRLRPDFPAALDLSAQLLHRLGKTAEGLHIYESLLRQHRVPAEIYNNYGSLLHQCGDIAQAITQYELALRADPCLVDAYFNLSEIARTQQYHFSDAAFATMTEVATDDNLEPLQYTRMCFSLAVACEQRHQISDAYRWLRRGNESVQTRQAVLYGESLHVRHLDFTRRVNDWALQLKPYDAAVGRSSTQPLFIVGMPRSGTSLLTQILTMHPDIATVGEADLLYPQLDRVMQDDGGSTGSRGSESHPGLSDVAAAYVRHITDYAANARYVIDKTPENVLLLGMICRLFPQARIVHLHRDPRDVCWSCYGHCFVSDRLSSTTADLAQLFAYYRHCEDVRGQWWDQMGPPRLQVQYEMLVRHPESTVRGILKLLGLPWHPACLEYQNNRYHVATASAAQVRVGLQRRSRAKWQPYLPYFTPSTAELFT